MGILLLRWLVGFLLFACVWRLSVNAQAYQVTDLNAEQMRALDRSKTAVILVGGMMEEHGPYLPAYTDGYLSERMAEELARAIAAIMLGEADGGRRGAGGGRRPSRLASLAPQGDATANRHPGEVATQPAKDDGAISNAQETSTFSTSPVGVTRQVWMPLL